jgi:hypothetical protein
VSIDSSLEPIKIVDKVAGWVGAIAWYRHAWYVLYVQNIPELFEQEDPLTK